MPIEAARPFPPTPAGTRAGASVTDPPPAVATPLPVVVTPYGRPALERLAQLVDEAKVADPLAPVTVVVPSNHVGVTARRALARGAAHAGPRANPGRGTIGVAFLTPYRLAELLGAPRLAAQGRRPVSTPVVAAALRQALRQRPGVFGPVATHPSTEEALVATYHELADVSPGGQQRVGRTSRRAADVVDVCRRARALLAGAWYDEADLLAAARQALVDATTADAAVGPVAALGHVVVHLPQDLNQGAAALLRQVAQACPTTVSVGLTGHGRADAGIHRSLARLGARLAGPSPEPRWPVAVDVTQVVTTSDADDEVRAAVRTVVEAARAGTPLERMAVLFATEQPYARLLHEHLGAAGITVNGTSAEGLEGRLLGRACLDLLALRDHGYRRRDVLGLLAAGGAGPAADWERLSRQAAVVAGRAQWDRRLAQLADELEHRAAEVEDVDDDRREARSARLQGRAERARRLREHVLDVVDELEGAAAAPQTWRARVDWLRRLLRRLVGGEVARAAWPELERKAAEWVEAALDRLVALDDVDGPADLDVFRRTLELELDADLGRVGRFGEGVLVAPLSFAVGVELDLLVVVGMAEGTLPARPSDDSLLPDRERHVVDGELPLRREQLDRQRRQLHAGLQAATRHVLCMPRGDLRASNERVPSRWLAEMLGSLGTPKAVVPSFAHGVTHVRFPATAQEFRLQALSAGPPRLHDPVVAAGRELQQARRSPRFTRFDGNLAGQPVGSPLDDVVSATRLESWATCPHAYFMRQVLHVLPTEDPADLLWISPLDRGSLVHEVLEQFLRAVLARPAEQQPGPDDAWSDTDHELLRQIGTEICADYEARGVVGRSVFWERDRARILGRLDRFLHEDSVRRRLTRSRPVAAELDFGLPESELGPVDVPIAGGRTLHFRGAADRIDVDDDGALRVIDYKTGRPYDYRALSEENPDDRGTHLQLAVYGVAARAHRRMPDAPVVAEYWFVTESGPLSQAGYPVTDDVLQRVGQTLGVMVDGIERGAFPSRPFGTSSDPFVRCPFCDPDGLGTTDRRREWERKRDDPAVRSYAQLAEPVTAPAAEPAERAPSATAARPDAATPEAGADAGDKRPPSAAPEASS